MRRQIWIEDKVGGVEKPMRTLRSSKQCKAALGLPKCPFTGTRPPEDSVFTPMLVPVHKLQMKW